MDTNQTPESTQELPTASRENFAKFIIEQRGGTFTGDHLQAVYMMKVNEMQKEGALPLHGDLNDHDKERLQGFVLRASDFANDELGVDEMGDWGSQFETATEIELFIEDQSEVFENELNKLLGENSG